MLTVQHTVKSIKYIGEKNILPLPEAEEILVRLETPSEGPAIVVPEGQVCHVVSLPHWKALAKKKGDLPKTSRPKNYKPENPIVYYDSVLIFPRIASAELVFQEPFIESPRYENVFFRLIRKNKSFKFIVAVLVNSVAILINVLLRSSSDKKSLPRPRHLTLLC